MRMRRQQSDGGRQLNFEFSDDDEDADGSVQGTLQPSAGAGGSQQRGLPTVSAGGQLRCQRACCRIGRQRCRDLSEQIGELSQLTDGKGYGAWMPQ